jgi:uncharacterized protein YukE
MSSELKVTDGIVDAAYLLNQVAEHLELTLSDLEDSIKQIEANSWQGESKQAFLSAIEESKQFHIALSGVSTDLIEATISMISNFDSAMATVESTADLSSLY